MADLPRLVATDLDGTLLRRNGTVSARTARALAAASARGCEVVYVTARPPRFVDAALRPAGLSGTALCANGAVTYRLGSGSGVVTGALDVTVARAAAAAVEAALPGVGFGIETGERFWYEPACTLGDGSDDPGRTSVPNRATLWQRATPVVKLLAHLPGGDGDAMLAAARAAVGSAVDVTHSGGPGLLEIGASGVTKADAVAAFCQRRGIDAAGVVAFGDMPNDLPLLRWAGRGYAVANAHPAVLAAATARTASNEEDGVARALESAFDLNVSTQEPDALPG